ncbi:hypothetical protein H632_c1326p1, partial [Helicosporidium sp. ATCC 50920]
METARSGGARRKKVETYDNVASPEGSDSSSGAAPPRTSTPATSFSIATRPIFGGGAADGDDGDEFESSFGGVGPAGPSHPPPTKAATFAAQASSNARAQVSKASSFTQPGAAQVPPPIFLDTFSAENDVFTKQSAGAFSTLSAPSTSQQPAFPLALSAAPSTSKLPASTPASAPSPTPVVVAASGAAGVGRTGSASGSIPRHSSSLAPPIPLSAAVPPSFSPVHEREGERAPAGIQAAEKAFWQEAQGESRGAFGSSIDLSHTLSGPSARSGSFTRPAAALLHQSAPPWEVPAAGSSLAEPPREEASPFDWESVKPVAARVLDFDGTAPPLHPQDGDASGRQEQVYAPAEAVLPEQEAPGLIEASEAVPPDWRQPLEADVVPAGAVDDALSSAVDPGPDEPAPPSKDPFWGPDGRYYWDSDEGVRYVWVEGPGWQPVEPGAGGEAAEHLAEAEADAARADSAASAAEGSDGPGLGAAEEISSGSRTRSAGLAETLVLATASSFRSFEPQGAPAAAAQPALFHPGQRDAVEAPREAVG